MASSGRVDVSTYKILLVVRSPTTCTRSGQPWRPLLIPGGMWGLFAVWEPDGAYNTVDISVGANNTVCVRDVEEHYSHRHSGYGSSIEV